MIVAVAAVVVFSVLLLVVVQLEVLLVLCVLLGMSVDVMIGRNDAHDRKRCLSKRIGTNAGLNLIV